MYRGLLRILAVLAVGAFALVACGDDDTAVDVGDDPTTTATDAPAVDDPDGTDDSDDDAGDEGDDAIDPDADREPFTGGLTFDADTGEVEVADYAGFLAEHGAPSTGVQGAALEFLDSVYGVEGPEPTVSSLPADGGRTVVTVIYEGLMDDSVAAERFELVFIGSGDDIIFESGSYASRCQEGRGHQEFATGLCI